jgi:hypothetical protein
MVFSSYRPAPGDTSGHPSAYLWYVERDGATWGSPVFMAEATDPAPGGRVLFYVRDFARVYHLPPDLALGPR